MLCVCPNCTQLYKTVQTCKICHSRASFVKHTVIILHVLLENAKHLQSVECLHSSDHALSRERSALGGGGQAGGGASWRWRASMRYAIYLHILKSSVMIICRGPRVSTQQWARPRTWGGLCPCTIASSTFFVRRSSPALPAVIYYVPASYRSMEHDLGWPPKSCLRLSLRTKS